MLRSVRAKLTFANVTASLALFLALSTGAAYATHEQIFSSDIVNGEVKRPDVGADAIASQEVVNNSLVGADIDESTLNGVDADLFRGFAPSGIVRIGGARTSVNVGMPDCAPGIDYMGHSIIAPRAGYVLVNVSFTASHPAVAGNEGLAARIEQTAPVLVIGDWQEGTLPPGASRDNISISQVFAVSQGTNSFALKVCDSNDFSGDGSGETIRGQMTFVYTPFALFVGTP